MTIDETLNDLLVRLFKDLMEIEGKALITEEYKDITNNDMHIIEAVGMDCPKKMSEIAKLMSVTTGTLTKAIDGLSRKGYVERKRDSEDKRVVKVSLTDRGRQAFYHHENFHRQMIEHIKDALDEKEMTVLVCFLSKLADYFQQIYDSSSEEAEFESWSNVKE